MTMSSVRLSWLTKLQLTLLQQNREHDDDLKEWEILEQLFDYLDKDVDEFWEHYDWEENNWEVDFSFTPDRFRIFIFVQLK